MVQYVSESYVHCYWGIYALRLSQDRARIHMNWLYIIYYLSAYLYSLLPISIYLSIKIDMSSHWHFHFQSNIADRVHSSFLFPYISNKADSVIVNLYIIIWSFLFICSQLLSKPSSPSPPLSPSSVDKLLNLLSFSGTPPELPHPSPSRLPPHIIQSPIFSSRPPVPTSPVRHHPQLACVLANNQSQVVFCVFFAFSHIADS